MHINYLISINIKERIARWQRRLRFIQLLHSAAYSGLNLCIYQDSHPLPAQIDV